MKRIMMIVGNGLSIGLRNWVTPQLEKWNPQLPLQWDLCTPGKPQVNLIQSLPQFYEVISSLRQKEPNLSNFDIFKRSLQLTNCGSSQSFNQAMLEAEMRHFLAIAYSHFQLQVDRIDLNSWPWFKWISTYGKFVQGVVSLNYDLVLESCMLQAGVSVRRLGIGSEMTGVPILKPHGSIDFDIQGITCPVDYPMKNIILRNDCPLRCLKRVELLEPRTEADIVLPNEYSSQLDYQWIKPGYDWFRLIGHQITHCIIIGISYWNCDRAEIDYILSSLSPRTKVIVANPSPPPYQMSKLRKRFHRVKIWRNGPEELANGV
jgi:hypothetical protein